MASMRTYAHCHTTFASDVVGWWDGGVYVDVMLPFRLRSVPKIFIAIMDGLEWWSGLHGNAVSRTSSITSMIISYWVHREVGHINAIWIPSEPCARTWESH